MAEYSATRRTPRKHKRVVMKGTEQFDADGVKLEPGDMQTDQQRQSDDDKRILGELPPHWAVFNEREYWLYAIIIGQAKKGDDTMKNIELSACEEMIMTIIWNNEAELDLAAVMTQTNERYHTAWKPQTVSTFLARAKKKGFLASYQKGRYSYYQPLVSKEEYRKMKLLALLTKFYDNDKEAMKKDIMA